LTLEHYQVVGVALRLDCRYLHPGPGAALQVAVGGAIEPLVTLTVRQGSLLYRHARETAAVLKLDQRDLGRPEVAEAT
jgi:hypothetical protein